MRWLTLIFVTCVVFIDEYVKHWAISSAPMIEQVENPGIVTVAVHKNWGIAFDIPFKLPVIVIVSIVLGMVLVRVAYTHWKTKPLLSMFATLILLGAAGNLYDRLAYGYTVDYLILFERSAINLSDLVILTGVFGMLTQARKMKSSVDETEQIS